MKAVKTIIGIIAALFAAAHSVMLIIALLSQQYEGTFAISKYMGNVIGIAIGLIVAILCFRKKTAPDN